MEQNMVEMESLAAEEAEHKADVLNRPELVNDMLPLINAMVQRRHNLRRALQSPTEYNAELTETEANLRILQKSLRIRIGDEFGGGDVGEKIGFKREMLESERYRDADNLSDRQEGQEVEVVMPAIVDDGSVDHPKVRQQGVFKSV